jgi:hypothetical protein
MMENLAFGVIRQRVCLALKRFCDPRCGAAASERARAGPIEADAPAARPSNDLIKTRPRCSATHRMIDTTRHHRTGLFIPILTLSSEAGEYPAPKATPSTDIVMFHMLDGGGSLVVASSDKVFIRVIRRLLSEPAWNSTAA